MHCVSYCCCSVAGEELNTQETKSSTLRAVPPIRVRTIVSIFAVLSLIMVPLQQNLYS